VSPSWLSDVRRVAEQIAGPDAERVDREGCFPAPTIDALREAGSLAALVPRRLGGPEIALVDVVEATSELARHCASSALVFAMHHIQVATLVRHGSSDAVWEFVERIRRDSLLLANANSEVGIGGDARRSNCAISLEGGRFHLEKDVLALSYGEYADAVLATARRGIDSAPDDQVMVICDGADLMLTPTTEWSALGLRGTCSRGFRLVASGPESYILPDFGLISTHTGLPVGNLLLSSVWVGIAEAAGARAHAYVRQQARSNIGTVPPAALPLADLSAVLQQVRDAVASAVALFETANRAENLDALSVLTQMGNVKITSSTLAVDVVQRALNICGLAGYLEGTPYSLGRLLRDVHGGPLMVNNGQIRQKIAQRLTMSKTL